MVKDRQISAGRLTIIRLLLDQGETPALVMTAVQVATPPEAEDSVAAVEVEVEAVVAEVVEAVVTEVEVRPRASHLPLEMGIPGVVGMEAIQEVEAADQRLPPAETRTPMTGS
jgi:hypothetical protein